jgi:ubiquinol-cytochrome c reductase cytochrome c subunit
VGGVRAAASAAASGNGRALIGWLVVGAVAAALVALTGGGGTAFAEPEADEELLQRGAELYAVNCAACHGPRGGGGPGETGITAGPPVAGIAMAYVDQQMRTGRMPLIDRTAGVVRPQELTDVEREATLAWMIAELELTGEIPEVGPGDPARGQELYTLNCAACHGSVGNGGISGRGVNVLGLRGIDPIAMIEATRVGPYNMPAFGEDLISEQDANDLAAFTSLAFEEPETTAFALTEQNRVALSALALLLVGIVVAGALLVSREVHMPTQDEEGAT